MFATRNDLRSSRTYRRAAAKTMLSFANVHLGFSAAKEGPCDIYKAGGTPCVAAHSLTRPLYAAFTGALYQVLRTSDSKTLDIGVAASGFADAAAQDAFCGTSACTVHAIYDQSSKGNHLVVGPPGGAHKEVDREVNATRSMISISGHPVYSAVFEGGNGYRTPIGKTNGIAVGDEPESMYAVFAGKHYNGGCCFDYGNAETDALDDGKGTMEAIYFGNSSGWGHGAGAGPWVMADLENGLWAGDKQAMPQAPLVADFVTAMVKGGAGKFALKGGDAQKDGALATLYEGVRPDGYNPMNKQGSIILGIGGDNSDWAIGTFYEGVMTAGYASDATDAAVHANIVAAGYGLK
tara:strand:+ start:401 stop:1450 length:1050 start_codon:yes stop_codon:yes gene_type:complete